MQQSPRYNFRYPELTDQVSAFPPDVAAQNALLLDQVIGSLTDTTTEALAGKADATATAQALAGKADATATAQALAGKAAASHTHTMGQVDGLDTALAGKADATATAQALAGKADATATAQALAGKAAASHTHTMGQVDGLDTALAGKADATATQQALARVTALEAMGGLSPESPVDGQTANLVLQGNTLTSKAIGNVVSGKVTESVAAPLAPLFLDPMLFGTHQGVPQNVRTAASSQLHGPGGGWQQEMSVPVVGTAGTRILTSTDTATVAGFVTQRWQAAVSSGGRDFFVEVVSTAPGGVINLRDPLPMSVDGHLSARYDDNQGQHLTRRGTRAYVEHLLNISPVVAARGAIIDGAWSDLPTSLQDVWRKNAAAFAADPWPIDTAAINSYDPEFGTPTMRGTTGHVSSGMNGVGQGLIADFTPAGRPVVLDFSVGSRRAPHDPQSLPVRVVVTADGKKILERVQTGWMRTYQIPLAGVDTVTVEVTSDTTTAQTISISNTTLRLSGQDVPPQGRGKIVTLGDSWMAWYDGEFGKALAEKTGAQVINRSLGGMTTLWGLAWWDEYVTKEKPDEVWIHFYTNDLNNLVNNTFTAPDGSTQKMWPSDAENPLGSFGLWRRNIWEMISRAQAAGIRPVIIMPSATAGPNQTQKHANASAVLETPPLDPSYIATAAEVGSTAWVGNRRHKYTGKPLQVGSSTVWATGPTPADKWENPAVNALASLQRVSMKRSAYVVDATNIRHSSYGNTSLDTIDLSTVEGVPHLTVTLDPTYTSVAHRIAGDVTTVAGREYLSVGHVLSATLPTDSNITNVTGTYQPIPEASGMPAGQQLLLRRGVATGTSATLQVGHEKANALKTVTQTELSVKLAVIDLTALLRDAPNMATATDQELALFALSLSN